MRFAVLSMCNMEWPVCEFVVKEKHNVHFMYSLLVMQIFFFLFYFLLFENKIERHAIISSMIEISLNSLELKSLARVIDMELN